MKTIYLKFTTITFLLVLLCCTLTFRLTHQDSNDYYNYFISIAAEHNGQLKNSFYYISYDSTSGNYSVSPIGKGGAMYVANSSVPLDQFFGKKVKILGNWVLTTRTLKEDGYPQSDWVPPIGAIDISQISVAH
jgi:hypothetical protein